MPAVRSHRAGCLAVAVVVALLVGGCADQAADSSAGAAPETTATVIPTTTTIPPADYRGGRLARRPHEDEGDVREETRQGAPGRNGRGVAGTGALLGKTVGACSRDLAKVGPPPSDRLQPVYTLANKACQQFTKAARCHATVARLSLPSGGVVVGSPQERP
jgi:hypothetical protein